MPLDEDCKSYHQLPYEIIKLHKNCDETAILDILHVMFTAFNVKSLLTVSNTIRLIRLLASYNINNDWILSELIPKNKLDMLMKQAPYLIIKYLAPNIDYSELLLPLLSSQSFPENYESLRYLLTNT